MIRKSLLLGLLLLLFVFSSGKPIWSQNRYLFPPYTVTNVIIVPSDVRMDPEYPRLVSEATRKVQAKYSQILGRTFKINEENGEAVVLQSEKPLKEFCTSQCGRDEIIHSMTQELQNKGFPVFRNQTVLNTFLAGSNFTAGGDWGRNSDSGMAWYDNAVMASFKKSRDRNSEILCEQYIGRRCSEEDGLYIMSHELGHSFGLLMASRWAKAHPCSTATSVTRDECQPDLDPKYYPGPEEANNSIMGYGINSYQVAINFNDSCVNPEKTLLSNSKYFGGRGFQGLNFENCLRLPYEGIKILGLEGSNAVKPGEEITIKVEGVSPNDQEVQVLFPPDNPSRTTQIIDNTIKAVVPFNAVSGDIIISRFDPISNQRIRSNPYPIKIINMYPTISSIDPAKVKPGDEITINGLNLGGSAENQETSPIVSFGSVQQTEILESSQNFIKVRVPNNVSVGTVYVSVQVKKINIQSKDFTTSSSNSRQIEIETTSNLQAYIEGDSTAFLGETSAFVAYVLENNSTPRATEMWVKRKGGNTPCDGNRQGDWCQIAKTSLIGGFPGRPQKITGDYVPSLEGGYWVIANVYGSDSNKCSGDSEDRPYDWSDCGSSSRFYFSATKKATQPLKTDFYEKISALYTIENKLEKEIFVKPKICEQEGCYLGPSYKIRSDSTSTFDYNFSKSVTGYLNRDKRYQVGCDIRNEYEVNLRICPDREAKTGDSIKFNFQVNESLMPTTSPSASVKDIVATTPVCSMSASSTKIKVGESIKWEIKNSPPGTLAYWRGSNNGISIIPTDVEGYSNTTSWSQEYKYTVPGYYERFVGIQDKEGKTVCTTDKVLINVGAEQVLIPIAQRSEPVNTALPIGGGQSGPIQTTQNLQKSVVGILVNGQWFGGLRGTSVSIRLPDIVARGATHAIPITIQYSDGTTFARNITFRFAVRGSEDSGIKASSEERCDPKQYSCFVMADQKNGSLEKLFCRNTPTYTNGEYKWVTQKWAYDYCQGKTGIKTICENKEGREETYYCTGQDWVDQAGWQAYQERQKKLESETTHDVIPQGSALEAALERQKQLGEEPNRLSCSLEASPQRIKVGENIAWTIQTQNFTGVSAQWHGTDNGQEFAGTVPVHGFPKPESPNSWTESYPYQKGGIYTRYALVKDSGGKTCQTNTVGVVIEDSNIAQGILPKVGEIPSSISSIVGQIGPKTVKQIVLLLPPYGQQREANPGDKIQFSLPDTGGVPQTIQIPVSIVYSDGSTVSKTISFSYKGNTCALSNGRCADSNGNTQDNYHCDEFRTDLSGCSLEKDRAHPYCYTKCSPKSTAPSGAVQTPTPTQAPTTDKDCSPRYTCADSDGITADKTKKCDLGSYRSDYIGCPLQYYCYTTCGPNQTSTPPQTGTTTANCSGAGEYCADSEGTAKDPATQCSTGNKAYRNNSAKDQWCQQGTPGWYCWLCQQ